MKKILFISLMIVILFLLEFVIFNFVTIRWAPNILLLFIIYINLVFGIRYALYAAVFSGILKDCFHPATFGSYLLSFVLCVFLITVFSQYLYHSVSRSARFILVFTITIFFNLFQYVLNAMTVRLDFWLMVRKILIPEVIMTLIVTSFLFKQFRKCVLKLYV